MELIANAEDRIDKYLANKLDYSRSKIQKMITSEDILVNGHKIDNNYKLKIGDVIYINENYDLKIDIIGENIPLDIVYEDEYLLVVNKPSGMVVHPAPGNYHNTLVNALIYHCKNLSNVNGEVRPGIVHRIDKDTSGLLLVAKNNEVHNLLAEQISKKTTLREYIALVFGIIEEDTATIDAPIGRDAYNRKKMAVTDINSKDAITHIKVLERYKDTTLISCKLETGRTHQIRVHLAYINHPIVNDPVYSNHKLDDSEFGQMLHAKSIGFIHPILGKYFCFTSPPPIEFTNILSKYKNR